MIKIHENVLKKLKEAQNGEGYFVTVSYIQEGKVYHYQRHERFPKEDLLPCLTEIGKLLRKGMN